MRVGLVGYSSWLGRTICCQATALSVYCIRLATATFGKMSDDITGAYFIDI